MRLFHHFTGNHEPVMNITPEETGFVKYDLYERIIKYIVRNVFLFIYLLGRKGWIMYRYREKINLITLILHNILNELMTKDNYSCVPYR